MAIVRKWTEPWLRFLGLTQDGKRMAVEILQKRYVEEEQRVRRFTDHAQRMQYPQFRVKLLQIVSDEKKHVEWIGEQIRLLGGAIPDVPEIPRVDANSWQMLLTDLEEERQRAAELMEEIHVIRGELPELADVLQGIYDDGKKHREEIQEMLIRSDPQALSLA